MTLALVRNIALTLAASGALLVACYVNEAQESAGNDASQDVGLHIRLDGNFVLNRDGSRVLTTGLLDDGGGRSSTYLIGVSIPGLRVTVGPSLEGLSGPEIMLTPDPQIAWLVGSRSGDLEIRPQFLDTMTQGPALSLPDGDFNAAILSGDGRILVLAEVWNPDSAAKISVAQMPQPPTATGAAPTWVPVDVPGALFDVRFDREVSRMVALSVPVDDDGHLTDGAIVSVFDVDGGGPALLASTRVEGFSLNLVGILTWAIRVSPDGRWEALSGRLDDLQATVVFDLRTGERYADFPCDGPVGFSPDSQTMVGFRDAAEGHSELVINDVLAKTSEAEPFAFNHPIFWIAPDGRRVVTYAMGERGLVITDLDLMATETVGGPEVALNEFAVGPDADFIYLVDQGALYLLDLELGEVDQLEPASRDYDNINILPGGDALILAARDTSRFELWSVVTAATEASVTLPTRL